MGMLTALESRLNDGELPPGGDGYYVRTKQNKKLGPMHGAPAARTLTLCSHHT